MMININSIQHLYLFHHILCIVVLSFNNILLYVLIRIIKLILNFCMSNFVYVCVCMCTFLCVCLFFDHFEFYFIFWNMILVKLFFKQIFIHATLTLLLIPWLDIYIHIRLHIYIWSTIDSSPCSFHLNIYTNQPPFLRPLINNDTLV